VSGCAPSDQGPSQPRSEDDGDGIAREDREVIFRRFERGDTTAGGTGIGLSLVATFAEMHGGRAWVEERPGGGASFRVALPRGEAALASIASESASPPAGAEVALEAPAPAASGSSSN
jgi:light-regulated signal transduction histidine kinase (bacteriophytochrome)